MTSTSSSSLSYDDRERLLDRFPVTDTELDLLLPLAQAYNRKQEHDPALFLELIDHNHRLADKVFSRKLVQERIERLFEATCRAVFLLGFDQAKEDALYRMAQFLEAAMILLGRRGQAAVEDALWQGGKSNDDNDEQDKPTATSLGELVYALVLAVEEFSSSRQRAVIISGNTTTLTSDTDIALDAPQAWISSLDTATTAVAANGLVISSPDFRQWIANVAPTLPFVLSTFFHWILLDSVERLSCPWSLPRPPSISGSSSSKQQCPSTILSNIEMVVPLVSMGLHGHLWKSLYQSTEQGLSYHTLQSHLTSFFGPTVLILQSTKGDILGYYTEIPWKITSTHTSMTSMLEMADGKDAFLFTLYPVWRRYGRTLEEPKGRMVQYLHGIQQRTNDRLCGISVGGVASDTPRLHIGPSLEECKAIRIGRCFQDGPLLGSEDDIYFDIEEIQLYAVAPDVETLVAGEQIGRRVMETKEALRQKLAQVDKKHFVDDLIFMPGHLFQHREQARGRADFVADDNEGHGYYIDSKPPSPQVPLKRG